MSLFDDCDNIDDQDIDSVKRILDKFPESTTHLHHWISDNLSTVKLVINVVDDLNFFGVTSGRITRLSDHQYITVLNEEETTKMLKMYMVNLIDTNRWYDVGPHLYDYAYNVGSGFSKIVVSNSLFFDNINPEIDKFELYFEEYYEHHLRGYVPTSNDVGAFIEYLNKNPQIVTRFPELEVLFYILDDDIPIDKHVGGVDQYKHLPIDTGEIIIKYFPKLETNILTRKSIQKIAKQPHLFKLFKSSTDENIVKFLLSRYMISDIDDDFMFSFFEPVCESLYNTLTDIDESDIMKHTNIFNERGIRWMVTDAIMYDMINVASKCEPLLDHGEYFKKILDDFSTRHMNDVNMLNTDMDFIDRHPEMLLCEHLKKRYSGRKTLPKRCLTTDINYKNLKRFTKTVRVDTYYMTTLDIIGLLENLNKHSLKLSKASKIQKRYFKEIVKGFKPSYGINSGFFVGCACDMDEMILDVSKIDNKKELNKYNKHLLKMLV